MNVRKIRLENEYSKLKKLEKETGGKFSFYALNKDKYFLRFFCRTALKDNTGIKIIDQEVRFLVYLPLDYPAVPPKILVIDPIFHPNIKFPRICLGDEHIISLFLSDICQRIYEILTYRNFTMDERISLNPEACEWARHNQGLFPTDKRPFKVK